MAQPPMYPQQPQYGYPDQSQQQPHLQYQPQQQQPMYGAPPQQYPGYPHGAAPMQHQQHYAPPPPAGSHGPSQLGGSTNSGSMDGVTYEVMYRDVNSVVKLTLNNGVTVKAKSGSMVAHSGNVKLEGKIKLKNMFSSGDVAQTVLTAQGGTGTVILAPPMFADLMVLEMDGSKEYIVGDEDDVLFKTEGISKATKANSLSGALFSGEGLRVTILTGRGLIAVSSLGAIHPLDLAPGEEYIVDNGHLVVWQSTVRMSTQSAGKSFFGGLGSGEGLVCKFVGPGRVYLQTRNPTDVGNWIRSHTAQS
ncbi:DUF124 domain protein [Powellomyces hirtus]|nr:DUF124 domain protein [Powellomyces hirtus]